MEKKSLIGMFVLAFAIVALLSAPPYARAAHGGVAPASGPISVGGHSFVPLHATAATPAPATTYPRTVLVETFTAQWCIYCELESQALYAIQHSSSQSVLVVPEIHVCYSSSNCGDSYTSLDSTSNTRSSYYAVSAFPDVFFDGTHQALGAAPNLPAMEAEYQGLINNASAVPGNVSISQSASVGAGTVGAYVHITSGVDGSFHAISYLEEFIGKNDSTGHDLSYVTRESVIDQTVTLTSGTTTDLSGSAPLGSGWNVQRLSVVTFVQQASTKIVQNANSVPVTTISTALGANRTSMDSGSSASVTVQVTNSSTGAPVDGAMVTLTSSAGGTLNPASGVTSSTGAFTSTFTAPTVSSQVDVVVSAEIAATGYTAGSGSIALTVNPLVLSDVPAGLTVAPGNQQVSITWTVPSTGSGGVTYYVYRSTSPTGTFTGIGISSTPSYIDSGLLGGTSYWYEVSAHNAAGFSANSTPVAATSVAVSTLGLDAYTGWWLSIDSANFTSVTSAGLALYLPDGFFGYEFGPTSYAFVAPNPSGTVQVNGDPLALTASFVPRYASLQGTVNPTTATVTVGGTSVPVVDGAYSQLLAAGTYAVVVTAPGYETSTSNVTLTPGNTTTVPLVTLNAIASPGGASPSGDWMSGNGLMLLVVVGVVGVAAVLGVVLVLRGRGGRRQPPRMRTMSPPDERP